MAQKIITKILYGDHFDFSVANVGLVDITVPQNVGPDKIRAYLLKEKNLISKEISQKNVQNKDIVKSHFKIWCDTYGIDNYTVRFKVNELTDTTTWTYQGTIVNFTFNPLILRLKEDDVDCLVNATVLSAAKNIEMRAQNDFFAISCRNFIATRRDKVGNSVSLTMRKTILDKLTVKLKSMDSNEMMSLAEKVNICLERYCDMNDLILAEGYEIYEV